MADVLSPRLQFTLAWVEPALTPQARHEDAARRAAQLARIVSIDAAYISHGEYYAGLATDTDHWSADLEERYLREITDLWDGRSGDERLLDATDASGQRIATAIVTSGHNGHEAFWIIQDMAVEPAFRRHGIAADMMDFIEAEARAAGVARLLLESGIGNHGAHALFERAGFQTLSKVFHKPLE